MSRVIKQQKQVKGILKVKEQKPQINRKLKIINHLNEIEDRLFVFEARIANEGDAKTKEYVAKTIADLKLLLNAKRRRLLG